MRYLKAQSLCITFQLNPLSFPHPHPFPVNHESTTKLWPQFPPPQTNSTLPTLLTVVVLPLLPDTQGYFVQSPACIFIPSFPNLEVFREPYF